MEGLFMSFWNDLGEKVQSGSKIVAEKAKTGGKAVADKAKELSQIASLKAQIASEENVINKNYKELGKAYYEAHKDEEEFTYSEYMTNIRNAFVKKAELTCEVERLTAADVVDASTVEDVPHVDSEVVSKTVAETVNDTAEAASEDSDKTE